MPKKKLSKVSWTFCEMKLEERISRSQSAENECTIQPPSTFCDSVMALDNKTVQSLKECNNHQASGGQGFRLGSWTKKNYMSLSVLKNQQEEWFLNPAAAKR